MPMKSTLDINRAIAHTCNASFALTLAVALPATVAAGEVPGASQEIDHLLSYVHQSGCMFFRNGSWYDARRAEAHIHAKYDFLLDRNEISTAEDFIDKAASKSSLSGMTYQVRCGDGQASGSGQWLKEELSRYRSGH